jgi:hypothetical protein
MVLSLSPVSSMSTSSDRYGSGSEDSTEPALPDSDDLNEIEPFKILARYRENLRDQILHQRYLTPRNPIPHHSQLDLLAWARENNLNMFRRRVRVNPETFDNILNLIQDHPIFKNNSNNAQIDVSTQLAITLNRFGHYGNAASLSNIGEWAGVSPGTVENCTKRVAVALLAHHDTAVHLPSREEKEKAKQFVASQVCESWRDGYLSVDGTTIDLFQKPGFFGEGYYDKSSRYSINTQVRGF